MLKIYNSLTREIQEFKPIKKNHVGIYVCGPTVYAPDHIGHARTWIFFDWLRRYFRQEGYKVTFVQNITDVGHLVGDEEEGEDKIEAVAKLEKKTPEEIADFYIERYFEDLKALNILKPDFSPRATDYIKKIIGFIEVLLKKGRAYEVSGNVYFDVEKTKDYGKLSGRDILEAKAETRVKIDPNKRNQADFALWLKAGPNHIQKWNSPWGEGYPGWHIECSVMSKDLLGQPFDIHGSASEHIFPHHENEIAQSEAYAEKPLANYFLHSGMLLIGGQKMSKSLNNFITISDLLKKYDFDTVKLAFMSTAWRKPFDWPASPSRGEEENAILTAKKLKSRLVRAKIEAQPVKTGYPTEIKETLEDDFNVPKALAVIFKNLNDLSRDDFKFIEGLFGLELREDFETSEEIKNLVAEREKARRSGDFKKADEIRSKLEAKGLIVEDTAGGSRILPKN